MQTPRLNGAAGTPLPLQTNALAPFPAPMNGVAPLRPRPIVDDLKGLDAAGVARVLRPDGSGIAIRDRAAAYLVEQASNAFDSQINIKLKAGFGPSPGNPNFPAFENPKDWLAHILKIAGRRLEGINESTTPAQAYKLAQKAIVDFENGIRDYHVGIFLNNTESSRLGFRMRYAAEPDGTRRYFVVEAPALGEEAETALRGAEIFAIDGQPIDELVTSLMAGGVPEFINKEDKDRSFATTLATIRVAALAMDVPRGSASVDLAISGQRTTIDFPWNYEPETRPAPGSATQSATQLQLASAKSEATGDLRDPVARARARGCTQYEVRTPCWRSATCPKDKETKRATLRADAFGDGGLRNSILRRPEYNLSNPTMQRMSAIEGDAPQAMSHRIGAKRSFLPRLGEPIVEGDSKDLFDWYVYVNEAGKRVGVVRINTYSPTDDDPNSETFGQSVADQASRQFGEIIGTFNQLGCEGLMIDQVNNPGGSVPYLYSLLAHLSPETMELPEHSLLISDDDRAFAVSSLAEIAALREMSPNLSETELAQAIFGEVFGGFPVDAKFLSRFEEGLRFQIAEYDAGRNLGSRPTYISSISEVEPHSDPRQVWTGPIVVYVNEDTTSGGDFFPIIMQDNERARIVGVSGAGAGGLVNTFDGGDQTFNVAEYTRTGSIAIRKLRPTSNQPKIIEGIGVVTDREIRHTVRDVQTQEYPDLVAALRSEVDRSMEA